MRVQTAKFQLSHIQSMIIVQTCSTCVTMKKRCIDGDFNLQKDQDFVDNAKYGKAIQFNRAMDCKFMWAKESKRKGTDVVSFTITAPMGRSSSVLETSMDLYDW